jgi:hypothetical protein
VTDGDKLAKEFSGRKLTRKDAIALAVRIDGLIDLARSEERYRCFGIVQDAWGNIIKPSLDGEKPR